jgi:acyl-CoA synthetase (AMP-forming)/AMP-acid ligase II
MKFVGQGNDSLDYLENIITDSVVTIKYKDLPAIFEKFNSFFAKHNINNDSCLTLSSDNSLLAALSVLYFFEEKYSFLILPENKKSAEYIPDFSRYIISIKEGYDPNIEDVNFENIFEIVENPKWNNKPVDRNPKLFLCTSGSTGFPKLVMHKHGHAFNNSLNVVKRFKLNSKDNVAIPVPIFHLFGLGAAFIPAIAVGASIDLQKGANVLRFIQREKQFEPNITYMTPVFCESLLKIRKSKREYKLTIVAGDRIKKESFLQYESFFGCLVQLYGSTEMGVMAAGNPDDSMETRVGAIGRPMSGVKMKSVKKEENSDNETGEIWCCHQFGFDGYLDKKGAPLTDSADEQEWFFTKDLGQLSKEFVEVHGRADHSVNRDGLLFFFADIEKKIETLEGIDSVVILTKGESKRGKQLHAFCIVSRESSLNIKDIRSQCFDILPARAIPDSINLVKSFPLLPNGKIDRQGCLKLVQ